MRRFIFSLLWLSTAVTWAEGVTEAEFRRAAGVTDDVALAYRSADCQAMDFAQFAKIMAGGAKIDMERAVDGKSMTVTVRPPPGSSCPSPYPPLSEMPAFDLKDLRGRRVTSAGLRGKPTLMNFYFAQCKPCILEVKPLNEFAKARPDLNILAVTFDEPREAQEFVQRFGFRWRVLPDAREFIDLMRVKSYPQMALFDAEGRLLGTLAGGARDELEAAAVRPRLTRWVDGLLRGR